MAKFKIVTPSAGSFTMPGAGYELEMEALQGLEAEIVEVSPASEDTFITKARDADALYAKDMPITKHIIDGLEQCCIIALGTVGVDSVDVPAATARGILEVLQQSDFVSMHAPATPETQSMLNETHFRQMKKTAIYINTGRGRTVDESALIKALREGWIAGAGLDVLETEPPSPTNSLLKMENVILTAHVASASARFDPARKRRVGQELALALSRRWPLSCVNPSVLQGSRLRRWR